MYICDGQGVPFSPVRRIAMAGQDSDKGGGVTANKWVCCMQCLCCVFVVDTRLEFREEASKGAAQLFIIVYVWFGLPWKGLEIMGQTR